MRTGAVGGARPLPPGTCGGGGRVGSFGAMGVSGRFRGWSGVARAVVASALAAASLGGCGQQVVPTGPAGSVAAVATSAAPASVPTPTASPAAPSATPPATATPSPTEPPQAVLPRPGGTCSADQFVITAPATYAYGYGTAFTTSVYFRQPLRNTGGACVLRLPTRVGVAGPDGLVVAVRVVNAGNAMLFRVRAGQALTVMLGAWWPLPTAPNATTWCRDPVLGVTRASFPLATGVIAFDLGMTVREVCPSPASMSVTIE